MSTAPPERDDELRPSPGDAVEMRRALTASDGTSVAYRLLPAATGRAGRVLVLLHGLASNLTRWCEFVEQTTLKLRWDILRIDLRGHGESFTRGTIGIEPWCDDLRRILDAERYEQAVLIGHSLGAQLAVHFAEAEPARSQGLVLIDPVFRQALRGQAAWVSRLSPLLRAASRLIRGLNALGLRRGRIPALQLRELDEQVRAAFLARGRAAEFVRRYTSPLADLRHFPTANYLRELVDLFQPLPAPESVQAPILVLLSRGVTFADPGLTQSLALRFPRAQVAVLDAYHWPLTERPLEVRRAIEEWCLALDRGAQ